MYDYVTWLGGLIFKSRLHTLGHKLPFENQSQHSPFRWQGYPFKSSDSLVVHSLSKENRRWQHDFPGHLTFSPIFHDWKIGQPHWSPIWQCKGVWRIMTSSLTFCLLSSQAQEQKKNLRPRDPSWNGVHEIPSKTLHLNLWLYQKKHTNLNYTNCSCTRAILDYGKVKRNSTIILSLLLYLL